MITLDSQQLQLKTRPSTSAGLECSDPSFLSFFFLLQQEITPSISHTRRVLAFYNNTVNKRLSQMA